MKSVQKISKDQKKYYVNVETGRRISEAEHIRNLELQKSSSPSPDSNDAIVASPAKSSEQADFTAKAVEVIYQGHVPGDEILAHFRASKFGLYKGFVKWHNGLPSEDEGEWAQKPHTHVSIILARKPRLPMKERNHYNYFKVGEVGVAPVLVAPLRGAKNMSLLKKMGQYVAYLVDGHDNGRYKDSWNYKYDHEIDSCSSVAAKIFVRQKRGEKFVDILTSSTADDQVYMIQNEKKIKTTYRRYREVSCLATHPASRPKLRPVQVKMLSAVDSQNDRKVTWVYDRDGDKGKTWFCRWMALYKDCCALGNGKKADISCAYRGQKYVAINLTRTTHDRVNYEAIEALKDGLLFDPKYQSGTYVRRFDEGHAKIIVMSNQLPDFKSMSDDRWDIITI